MAFYNIGKIPLIREVASRVIHTNGGRLNDSFALLLQRLYCLSILGFADKFVLFVSPSRKYNISFVLVYFQVIFFWLLVWLENQGHFYVSASSHDDKVCSLTLLLGLILIPSFSFYVQDSRSLSLKSLFLSLYADKKESNSSLSNKLALGLPSLSEQIIFRNIYTFAHLKYNVNPVIKQLYCGSLE